MYHEDMQFYEEMKRYKSNRVSLQVEENTVHDIILVGDKVGFEEEAKRAARRAGEWLTKTIAPK